MTVPGHLGHIGEKKNLNYILNCARSQCIEANIGEI